MFSLFEKLLDRLAQGVLLVDKNYRVIVWNQWLEKASGLKRTDVIGKKVANVCPCFKELRFRRILSTAIVDGQSSFCSGMLHKAFVVCQDDNQEVKRQNMQVEPFEWMGEVFALIQIIDITVQHRRVRCLQNLVRQLENDYQIVKRSEESAKERALHDFLTGLCNRQSLFEHLKHDMSASDKDGQLLAVLFIDLDQFKTINDTYGHITGDAILKEAAVRIKHAVRSTDTVARFGGDEFIVVLPNITTSDKAILVAHKIRRAIGRPFDLIAPEKLTASIGISLYPVDADNMEELLEKADCAMYLLKGGGKNDCKVYTRNV